MSRVVTRRRGLLRVGKRSGNGKFYLGTGIHFTQNCELVPGRLGALQRSFESKLELQPKLDRARSADLIQGIEAAAGAAGTETIRQRLR
jgi:hypothetical protein